MITTLHNNIGVEVECLTDDDPTPKNDQCEMGVKIHALRSLAEMGIIKYGPDTLQVIRQELRKLFMDEIQVVELYLNIEDAMTPVFVPDLEKMGFIFTGILPETAHGNSMIMQYFNGVHIDYDQLVIVSDVAQNLLEYIRRPHFAVDLQGMGFLEFPDGTVRVPTENAVYFCFGEFDPF